METAVSTRQQIINMEVGQSESWPLSRYNYIVSAKYRIGLDMGREYKSTIDREAGTVTLERIS